MTRESFKQDDNSADKDDHDDFIDSQGCEHKGDMKIDATYLQIELKIKTNNYFLSCTKEYFIKRLS